MSESIHRIDEDLINKIVIKQQERCIYCHNKLNLTDRGKTYNVEHLIPQAIYKWNFEKNNEALYNIITHIDNLAITCKKCNTIKGSKILEPYEFNRICENKDVQYKYKKLYNKANHYIGKYRHIKIDILHKQSNACKICNKYITINSSDMRRVYDDQIRSMNNVMCLCEKCNSNTYKIKMYRKKLGQIQQ